jgi:hypothetical protein
MPRKLHKGKARRTLRVGKHGRQRAYIEIERNHPFVVAYVPQLLRAWRGNTDLQFIVEPHGSVEYSTRVACYSTNSTKPEAAGLQRRVARAIRRLQPGSNLRTKIARITNAYLGSQQVTAQQALSFLLGGHKFPVVKSSRTVEDYSFQMPGEQPLTLNLNLFDCTSDSDKIPTHPKKKQLIQDTYLARGGEKPCPLCLPDSDEPYSWDKLCLLQFLSWFYIPLDDTTKSGANRWTMANGQTIAMHRKEVAISTMPYISTDKNDERAAFAMMKLWLPHSSESELLQKIDNPTH